MIDITIPDELITRQFMATMADAGIVPTTELLPLDASGAIVRFSVEGDEHGEKSGAYFLHGDGLPCWGVMQFGRHERMIQDKFRFDRMTRTEQDAMRAANRPMTPPPCPVITPHPSPKRPENREALLARALARYRAGVSGEVVAGHPFVRARFLSHGIRLSDIAGFNLWGSGRLAPNAPRVDAATGALLFPLLGVASGRFHGLQWQGRRYADNGHWMRGFVTGTAPMGASYVIQPAGARTDLVCVCEGIATGLAVLALMWRKRREAVCVYCAMTAQNIAPVCMRLRGCRRDACIMVMADNDAGTEHRTGKNPGVTSAETAKRAGYADYVCVPSLSPSGTQNVDWYDALLRS